MTTCHHTARIAVTDRTAAIAASTPAARAPTVYLVTWPGCGTDFQRHATELEARMAADFAARMFGEAVVHRNDGRTTPIARITVEDIRAAEARES